MRRVRWWSSGKTNTWVLPARRRKAAAWRMRSRSRSKHVRHGSGSSCLRRRPAPRARVAPGAMAASSAASRAARSMPWAGPGPALEPSWASTMPCAAWPPMVAPHARARSVVMPTRVRRGCSGELCCTLYVHLFVCGWRRCTNWWRRWAGWILPAATVGCWHRWWHRRRVCAPGSTAGTWPSPPEVEQIVSYPEKILADASHGSLKDAERTVKRAQTTRVLPQLGEALADGVVSGAHVDVAGRWRRCGYERGRSWFERLVVTPGTTLS